MSRLTFALILAVLAVITLAFPIRWAAEAWQRFAEISEACPPGQHPVDAHDVGWICVEGTEIP